jgi:hypothetical protein
MVSLGRWCWRHGARNFHHRGKPRICSLVRRLRVASIHRRQGVQQLRGQGDRALVCKEFCHTQGSGDGVTGSVILDWPDRRRATGADAPRDRNLEGHGRDRAGKSLSAIVSQCKFSSLDCCSSNLAIQSGWRRDGYTVFGSDGLSRFMVYIREACSQFSSV